MSANNGHSRWMSEEDVMMVTGLKRTALYERRKEGVFNWRHDNGRKIKYLHRDVEAYLSSNSTITKNDK
ncbi:helix-turn-helix domain-containing protein [Niabella sp. W65]|nr:helix-turn-helix domain-containing protein [Niabella sp. W65]MCH7368596.1 helix-turn-helix domain-containing protein [Niabella sp. W65]